MDWQTWAISVEAVVDAMSVFTNIVAADIKLPLEESLVAIVMAIREQFIVGHLKGLMVVPDRSHAGGRADQGCGAPGAVAEGTELRRVVTCR